MTYAIIIVLFGALAYYAGLYRTVKKQVVTVDHANRQLVRQLRAYMEGQDFLTALRAANIARQIEWQDGQEISLEYRGNEAAGEMGEFCNVIKKLARERLGIKGSRATVQDLKEEGADVVICVDLIFKEFGIDLAEAVREKFNMTSDKVGLQTKL